MLKKYIISLLSLFIIFGAKQAFAADGQKKASPAVQQFFEAGNHDDAKLHMLGYLANHRNLASLVEEQGKFSDALKTLVNLKDKTLQEGLDKLLAPINQNGRINVNARNIRIQCAQDAVKSGNQKMLETFLPEIFVENPQEHVLFPQDLRSQESLDLLKQTELLDLACRYHGGYENITRTIASKFLNVEFLGADNLREYAPVYTENRYKTDMEFAIDTKDKNKMQELLYEEEDRNKRLSIFKKIVTKHKSGNAEELKSFLDVFSQEKNSFDRTLLWKKKFRVLNILLGKLVTTPETCVAVTTAISLIAYKVLRVMISRGYLLSSSYRWFTSLLTLGITSFSTAFSFGKMKQINNNPGKKLIAKCNGIFGLLQLPLVCYLMRIILQTNSIKMMLLLSSGSGYLSITNIIITLILHSLDDFKRNLKIKEIIYGFFMMCPVILTELTKQFFFNPLKKTAKNCFSYAKSFLRSPWQKTKNAFSVVRNVVSKPRHYISCLQTKLLQKVI